MKDWNTIKKEYKENGGCESCKHYFNLHIDNFTGEHNVCNEEKCYLCAYNSGGCYDYEKGDVPLGEIRGEDEYDRKRRKAKRNLITLFLYCGGADGVSIYVDKEYVGSMEYGYDLGDILPNLFGKLNLDNKDIRIRQIDVDDIDLGDYALPNTLPEEAVDALWINNIELFTHLIEQYVATYSEEEEED